MSSVITPHAAAIIWNYRDRIAAEGANSGNGKVNEVDQIVISTLSLISISTTKTKSSPQGSFQLTLAPTKNWVTAITPGSWIVLLMSNNPIEKKDLPDRNGGGTADPNKVKFLGRVESVKAEVNVNEQTGARNTFYTVTGPDWGQIFTSILYVDPLARDSQGTAIGTSLRYMYEESLLDITATNLPTSDANIQALKRFWGASVKDSEVFGDMESNLSGTMVRAEAQWVMPSDLIRYMGFKGVSQVGIGKANPKAEQLSSNLADIVEIVGGRVKRDGKKTKGDVFDGVYFDDYDKVNDSVGIIHPDSIFGQNQFWQLMVDNCNPTLNEMLCDLRWRKDGTPVLALYKRIKPFLFRDPFKVPGAQNIDRAKKTITPLMSKFTDLRTVEIPLKDILKSSAGTNWRDKYNFVEVLFDNSLSKDFRNVLIKNESQSFDSPAFSREGFRPMLAISRYVPTNFADRGVDPFKITDWKFLLREWYFNTHVLLNGTLNIMGQNNYIQVGDNILFDGRAIGYEQNINSDAIKKRKNNDSNPVKILAHVESITHTFKVNHNGTRSFRTSINFVRGLVVGEDRKPFTDGRIDIDSQKIGPKDERNIRGNFASSSDNDPDPQKLDGGKVIK